MMNAKCNIKLASQLGMPLVSCERKELSTESDESSTCTRFFVLTPEGAEEALAGLEGAGISVED
ncbi:MAG: hypothetical protein RH917_09365 [Lacipirellulaceae bacterium]